MLMRTLRLALPGTVMLALLGGLGGAVAVQDDPMAPALVTGTATYLSKDSPGTLSFADDAIVREGVVFTHHWEASDPRLSGTSTVTWNWHDCSSGDVTIEAATRVVENDDGGRWVGTGTGLSDVAGAGPETVVLHGEGVHEGLTAYVLMDWDPHQTPQATFDAAIFPGGMPPFPELLAE
jgi:hypothetical protein